MDSSGLQRAWLTLLSGIATLVAWAFALYGLVIVGWQVLYWLELGQWIQCSLLRMFEAQYRSGPQVLLLDLDGTRFAQWLRYPDAWLGLHEMVTGFLAWIPTAFAAFAIAWGIGAWGESLSEERRRLETGREAGDTDIG